MKKIAILITIIFILSWCYNDTNKVDCSNVDSLSELSLLEKWEYEIMCNYDKKNKCVNLDWFLEGMILEEWKYKMLCEYKKKFDEEGFSLRDIYLLSKSDKEYALSKLHEYNDYKELDDIETIQLYLILNRIYLFNDIKIKNDFWINLKDDYLFLKSYSFKNLFSVENLLLQGFEWEVETLYWIQMANWKLTYNDVLYLQLIFELEPSRFTSINLEADIEWGYKVLKDEKSKIIYKEIMFDLSKNIKNKESKIIIDRFLDFIK